jgi:hypothetical protein
MTNCGIAKTYDYETKEFENMRKESFFMNYKYMQ